MKRFVILLIPVRFSSSFYALDKVIHSHYHFLSQGNPLLGFQSVITSAFPVARDHSCILEFKGKWHYFYHVDPFTGASFHRRTICWDEFFYNPDGMIRKIIQT